MSVVFFVFFNYSQECFNVFIDDYFHEEIEAELASRRIRHLLPLISAIVGCIVLFVFAILSFLSPPISTRRFLHRSYSLHNRFEVDRRQESRLSKCMNLNETIYMLSAAAEVKTDPNRYLMIATSGGLNQQRTGITDAVVVAYILNATLVVPKLDQNSFWKDASNFSEIFDVDWFISYLSKDVKIIKELPFEEGKNITPYRMRVPRKCTPECYEKRVLPILKKKQVIQLGKFDYRLSNHLDADLQKMRCRVNYHALQFTDPIILMGQKLVERMRMKSKHFIALHLRFEPDMLAFSGCYYGGGEKERSELGTIRKRWKTLHNKNPEKERRHGKCPLTPEEVGLMLRALGYRKDVHMYVASGEVYGGEETLAPLKALFPNFHTKVTIASKEELEPFLSFSSRMAALDFIVCDKSDVFVTNNNGNMARILAGRRRYFGHKPTIRPNAKKLYKLFMAKHNTSWEEFSTRIQTHQIGFMGEPNEIKVGRGEFHENPTTCICGGGETESDKDARLLDMARQAITSHIRVKNNNSEATIDEIFTDYDDDYQGKGTSNITELETEIVPKLDQSEPELMFSD
ncbi:protein ROOT HAIR SPECIFIC 17-like [Impatiens glandulifera]|uniref:protein ROOT HAIR SPECIFIC 17-like n=1 Tax=Impatiens glandulifera TaxID=253017 RepID=UPI001FB0BE69|nr:protein ROOT HAIR SPECIFIC 17-like [Impatiens glandulifera]